MRKWLKEMRQESGLTQEHVAQITGIARTTYAMIEQGERDPSVAVAKKIARVLCFNWTLFLEIEYTICVFKRGIKLFENKN